MDVEEKIISEGEGAVGAPQEGTSPSAEGGIGLSSSPVPTAEEIHDAETVSAEDGQGLSGDIAPAAGSSEPEGQGGMPNGGDANAEAGNGPEAQPAERTFTQSQVNELVGKTRMETREQTYRAIYGHYGVDDEKGLDELVGNAQRYETVRQEFDDAKTGWQADSAARDAELAGVKEHVALLESGIDRSRFDDAKAIIKSKGLEVTVETIQSELATHPEWKGAGAGERPNPNFAPDPNAKPQEPENPEPVSTITALGNEGQPGAAQSEEDYVMSKYYKI